MEIKKKEKEKERKRGGKKKRKYEKKKEKRKKEKEKKNQKRKRKRKRKTFSKKDHPKHEKEQVENKDLLQLGLIPELFSMFLLLLRRPNLLLTILQIVFPVINYLII